VEFSNDCWSIGLTVCLMAFVGALFCLCLVFLVDIPGLDGFLLHCWIFMLPDICYLSFVLGCTIMVYSGGSLFFSRLIHFL
jgi:hypothetical protein